MAHLICTLATAQASIHSNRTTYDTNPKYPCVVGRVYFAANPLPAALVHHITPQSSKPKRPLILNRDNGMTEAGVTAYMGA